jgi:predicted DNA-binding protein (UPF0251 family)
MKKEKTLDWYQNQIQKDKEELEREKHKFIKEIKQTKKQEILGIKKYTLWQRIKKILTGT